MTISRSSQRDSLDLVAVGVPQEDVQVSHIPPGQNSTVVKLVPFEAKGRTRVLSTVLQKKITPGDTLPILPLLTLYINVGVVHPLYRPVHAGRWSGSVQSWRCRPALRRFHCRYARFVVLVVLDSNIRSVGVNPYSRVRYRVGAAHRATCWNTGVGIRARQEAESALSSVSAVMVTSSTEVLVDRSALKVNISTGFQTPCRCNCFRQIHCRHNVCESYGHFIGSC